MATLSIAKKTSPSASIVILTSTTKNISKFGLTPEEVDFIKLQIDSNKKTLVTINQFNRFVFINVVADKKDRSNKTDIHLTTEAYRRAGGHLLNTINEYKLADITLIDADNKSTYTLAYAEGLALASYQFLKYRKDAEKEQHSLKNIFISSPRIDAKKIEQLQLVVTATNTARNLVNEPVIYLTAKQLAKEFELLGKDAGFSVEVFNKSKIESLKMGGLLAVNSGSKEPPTFTIMEWKPRKAKNKKPYVLVGKGVVYDTGGLSLKPTLNSMDTMKCDMAGAAAVGATLWAIAKAKLPVHVIGLVPATDNRPGEIAYTPGDVIKMHNGLTIEVLNTDAEGRMILGDALSYAQQYNPELVIDLATLTGAAAAAIGKYAIVTMGTAGERVKNKLKESGDRVHERLVEMPFWEEYGELLKSKVADLKNIGGPVAGAITAGKFLEHFTNYPWMHFDIAGPAFLTDGDPYKPYGGTGSGVRILFDFFKNC